MTDQDLFGVTLLAGAAALLISARKKKMKKPLPDPLDHVLMTWAPGEPFSVRDLLSGGVLVMGRPGSGKSSGSGKMMMRSIAAYPRSGGIILGPKPEDVDDARRVFAQAGRRDDLVVMQADGEVRINILDSLRAMRCGPREITGFLTTMSENLHASHSQGGEESGFFKALEERAIYNATVALMLGTGKVSAPDLQRFIHGSLMKPEQAASPEWQEGFHNKCLGAASANAKTDIAKHDFDQAANFWIREWPRLADKTRSCVMAGVLSTLHPFNSGLGRQLISTSTNFRLEEMLQGRWLFVNLPPAQFGDTGTLINCALKYASQLMVLRRQASPGDPIHCIWADEFQVFANSFDSHYLAQCRSHLGCMVALTQSLHGIFTAMRGEAGKHQALGLLSCFHHKVFHALGDSQTAEYAAGLLGKELQSFVGCSMAPDENLFETLMGNSKVTSSFSEHYEYVVQPNVFMNGLRTGGRLNGFQTDAIIVKSGEPFWCGKNWLFTHFDQR